MSKCSVVMVLSEVEGYGWDGVVGMVVCKEKIEFCASLMH